VPEKKKTAAPSTEKGARKLEWRPIAELEPYARNPRTHSEEQVKQVADSIARFGFTNPILLNGKSGIIAGHGRLLAAKSLGMETVPCIDLNGLTEAEQRAYVIADNKLALNAGWDTLMLRDELTDLSGEGIDAGLLGFAENELRELMIEPGAGGNPELPSGNRPPFQEMTFVLSDEQVDTVKEAIKLALGMCDIEDAANTNKNGNALARICELFITEIVPDESKGAQQ
jgi:ParB family chromosome partitioning protein